MDLMKIVIAAESYFPADTIIKSTWRVAPFQIAIDQPGIDKRRYTTDLIEIHARAKCKLRQIQCGSKGLFITTIDKKVLCELIGNNRAAINMHRIERPNETLLPGSKRDYEKIIIGCKKSTCFPSYGKIPDRLFFFNLSHFRFWNFFRGNAYR